MAGSHGDFELLADAGYFFFIPQQRTSKCGDGKTPQLHVPGKYHSVIQQRRAEDCALCMNLLPS